MLFNYYQLQTAYKTLLKIKDEYNTDRSMIDETDQTVIVCMDFVKGKCHRDMKCKYYHPEAHLIVSENRIMNLTNDSIRTKSSTDRAYYLHNYTPRITMHSFPSRVSR